MAHQTTDKDNFYLNFILKNSTRPFEYIVNVDDWTRVSEPFLQDLLPNQFIIFQELEKGRKVHVNSDFVLFHQALFDTGLHEQEMDLAKESIRPVEFYLDGLSLSPPSEEDLVDKTRCIFDQSHPIVGSYSPALRFSRSAPNTVIPRA